MNDTEWKKEVYEPYLETWKILKLIQYADQSGNYDDQWARYMKEIDRLCDMYPDSKFVENLTRLLFDAGDSIAKRNNKA